MSSLNGFVGAIQNVAVVFDFFWRRYRDVLSLLTTLESPSCDTRGTSHEVRGKTKLKKKFQELKIKVIGT